MHRSHILSTVAILATLALPPARLTASTPVSGASSGQARNAQPPPTAAPVITLQRPSYDPQNVTFTWTAVDRAASYRLQLKSGSDDWSDVLQEPVLEWSSNGKLRTTGTYQLRVQACNHAGCGPWSAVEEWEVAYPL